MVPASLAETAIEDDLEVRELIAGDPDFVHSVRIEPNGGEASWSGYRLQSLIDSRERTIALDPTIPLSLTYPIHRGKLTDPETLAKRGFIRFDPDSPDFAYFSPSLGAAYMALLATATAAERGVPIVSHSERYNALARSEIVADHLPVGRPTDRTEARENLALMALSVAVPDIRTLGKVTVDQILGFRKTSRTARRKFFDFISEAADRVASEGHLSREGLAERAHDFERQIREDTLQLKHDLESAGIRAVTRVLLVDGKVHLSGAGTLALGAAVSWAVPPVTVGAVALGVLSVIREWRALRGGLRASSPYSYLLDIEEQANPGSLVERAGRGLLHAVRGE
jgi:hypothetical protein